MFPMITERGNTSSLPCKPETGEITLMPHCHQVKLLALFHYHRLMILAGDITIKNAYYRIRQNFRVGKLSRLCAKYTIHCMENFRGASGRAWPSCTVHSK